MNNYEFELTIDNIKTSIEKDGLRRNQKINKLIDLLNNTNSNKIISINGKWGCGKTVFLKQLEFMNKSQLSDLKSFDKTIISLFQEKYEVYYYNAWANDLHSSALLSLIYNLINEYPSEKDQTSSSEIELPFNFKELLKTISSNFIDLDKVESFYDISKEIYTIEEKKRKEHYQI